MLELFAGGFLIGVTVGAPIGPIGTTSLIQVMAGNLRAALAGMAGCIAAEMVLVTVAILATAELKAYLVDLPAPVYLAVAVLLLAIGLHLILAARMPKLGRVASFLLAFKVTLLSPNNLVALMALIAAMGFASRLDRLVHNLAFVGGELIGLVACWSGVLWLGWRVRSNRKVGTMIPWLRRGVGLFVIVMAIAIIVRQF
jgi:threonine/homoserine/homoserine lactone efflux protein